MDRLIVSGASVFIVDLKGEYTKKYMGLQAKFHKFLMRGEEPEQFKIKIYYPYFMAKITGKKREKFEHFIQFGFKDLTKFDFMTLIPHSQEQNIKPIVDSMWIEILNNRINSYEEMIGYIQESEDLHHSSKKILIYSIKSLIKSGVLGDEFDRPSVINDLNNGLVVILNLQGITRFPNTNNNASTYLAIMIRDIYASKVSGKLDKTKHHIISIDEINKFCPRMGFSVSKDEILKLYDLSRHARISLIGSTQDYQRVPQTIVSQSNYIFLAHNTSLNDSSELIKNNLPEEYDVPQTFKSKVAGIFTGVNVHKDGSRDWLLLDKINAGYKILSPYAPLTYIQEEME